MSLRFVLLALLSEEPDSGYGLGRRLSDDLPHAWSAKLQQVYAELASLQQAGLVTVECVPLRNRPAKKVYSLTEAGEQALNDWIVRSPRADGHRDGLLIRLLFLARVPPDVMARQVEHRRREALREAAHARRSLPDVGRSDLAELGRFLSLEAARARAEAEAAWCKRALALLAATPGSPSARSASPALLLPERALAAVERRPPR